MTKKTYCPDEKSIEVVFAAYAARLAHKLGKTLITYAPSQTMEKELAYDSRLIGSGCRELYMQFKKSSSYQYGFAFRPSDKDQLENLQKKYPPRSAFYIAASFPADKELFASQYSLSEEGFLDKYFAVDARILGKTSNSVRFNTDSLEHKTNIKNYPNHGEGRKKKEIYRPNWLTAYELLCDFLGCIPTTTSTISSSSASVGSRVVVRKGKAVRLPLDVKSNNKDADLDAWGIDRNVEDIFITPREMSLMFRVFDN